MKTYISMIIIVLFLSAGILYGVEVSDIKMEELQKLPKTKWGRDPFTRYDDRFKTFGEAALEEPVTIRINGIISNGRRAMAIINGGFYRVGDSVGDFRISAIGGDRVMLEKNGKKFYLGVDRFAMSVKGK